MHCACVQVAKREEVSAGMSALMALCEKTENDIRSCLNTLQVHMYIYILCAFPGLVVYFQAVYMYSARNVNTYCIVV